MIYIHVCPGVNCIHEQKKPGPVCEKGRQGFDKYNPMAYWLATKVKYQNNINYYIQK